MLLQGLEDGVQTHAHTTGFARESHGRCQVSSAQALAVEGVVIALLAVFLEPDGLVELVVVVELGAQDAACADRLAIGFEDFIDHREACAFAQGAVEVDLARKDVGQLADHGVRQAGFIGCGIQRAGHRAARHAHAGAQCGRLLSCLQALGRALDHQTLECGVGFIAQPAHAQLAQLLLAVDFGRNGAT